MAVTVADGVVHLSGELENRSEVHLLEELTRRIAGVVKVDSEVTYQIDDRKTEGSGPL
jgi:osmotically-inducible protein OsmY